MIANHPPHPLRAWRLAHGLTLSAVGSLIGASKYAVSNYELGRRFPRPAKLAAIVRVTSGAVTADDFLHAGSQRGAAE